MLEKNYHKKVRSGREIKYIAVGLLGYIFFKVFLRSVGEGFCKIYIATSLQEIQTKQKNVF